jgi:hypothetical protein
MAVIHQNRFSEIYKNLRFFFKNSEVVNFS